MKYTYTHSARQQVGTMSCTRCGKEVVGQYRFSTNDNGHWAQHRACSADDPKWAKLDAEKEAHLRRLHKHLEACRSFMKQHDVSMQDEIDTTEMQIAQLEKA